MGGTDSGSCPVAGSDVSSVESPHFTLRQLVNLIYL